MSSPLQVISVRLPNKLNQQLKVLAVARRQNPSELIREMIECEAASSGSPARQLQRKAAAEAAKFFGTPGPCVAEENRPQLSDEQLEIAKKFASR